MSSNISIPNVMGNGGASETKQPTPADMVGNQFVSQFYTVLHSSPRYLHRFYTDESTVTHADCGIDGDSPSSVTVTTQKGISERVSAMGFEEAVTEIWSVDSQYSQNNGVLVMVTGSLQCKGKKKRDFVQSFFLAVQEKGYFVLNDSFRYLSDRTSRPSQYPKENGYMHGGYEKMAGYHQSQHNYYPGQVAQHGQGPAMYANHNLQAYTSPASALPSTQGLYNMSRGQAAVLPSLPQQHLLASNRVSPASSKAGSAGVASSTAGASIVQQPQAHQPLVSTNVAPTSSASSVPEGATEPPAGTVAAAAPEPPSEAPSVSKTSNASVSTEPLVEKEASKPQEAATTAAASIKPLAKPEPNKVKSEAAPKLSERPAQKLAESSAPLSYADKLRLGSRGGAAGGSKATAAAAATSAPTPTTNPTPASKPSSTSPKPSTQPPPALLAGKSTEPAQDIGASSDWPGSTSGPPNGSSGANPDEAQLSSIFVRDLPEGTTADRLVAEFSRFGPIKGGVQGITLKVQKGKEDYAFVEFEETAAMQAAMAGQVIIEGRQVTVLEKKPQFPKNLRGPGYQRSNDRGRGGEARGFRGGGAGRSERGRGPRDGRDAPRPYTGGRDSRDSSRSDARMEGRDSTSFRTRGMNGGFGSEARNEIGRGRGERGGRNSQGGRSIAGNPVRAPQSAPSVRPQQS